MNVSMKLTARNSPTEAHTPPQTRLVAEISGDACPDRGEFSRDGR